MEQTKICIKCKQDLPLSNYGKSGGAQYLRPECKQCATILNKKRQILRNIYGQPPQNYVCPICKKSQEECAGKGGKHAATWVVDHCHKTDKFRGWLCHRCNRAIGNFDDDVELLNNAINYLQNGV